MFNPGLVSVPKPVEILPFNITNKLCRHHRLREPGLQLREHKHGCHRPRLRHSVPRNYLLSTLPLAPKPRLPAPHSASSHKLRAERQAMLRRHLFALTRDPTSNLNPRYSDSSPLAPHILFRILIPLLASPRLGQQLQHLSLLLRQQLDTAANAHHLYSELLQAFPRFRLQLCRLSEIDFGAVAVTTHPEIPMGKTRILLFMLLNAPSNTLCAYTQRNRVHHT